MSYEKIGKLVTMLCQKTRAGQLSWTETERDGVYQTSFTNHSVRLFVRPNRDSDSEDYVVQIINSEGSVVEEVSDVDLGTVIRDPYPKLKAMYGDARRQALGVDDALNDILEQLSGSKRDDGFDDDIPF